MKFTSYVRLVCPSSAVTTKVALADPSTSDTVAVNDPVDCTGTSDPFTNSLAFASASWPDKVRAADSRVELGSSTSYFIVEARKPGSGVAASFPTLYERELKRASEDGTTGIGSNFTSAVTA